jgi:predicted deacylase
LIPDAESMPPLKLAESIHNTICLACHSIDGTRILGPTFKGMFGRKQVVIREGKEVHVTIEEKATLSLQLQPGSVLVSAQELILPEEIDSWAMKLAKSSDAEFELLGLSLNERPIHVLQINPDATEVVLLVGRQHPAEVTGSLAMSAFVNRLFGEDEVARAFRERFNVIILPMMNPDGVVAGNWRHNEGGVDLNRDWGPFWQPEPGLIRELIEELYDEGKSIHLFVDFHSTNRNLMYTQMDYEPISPAVFTNRWVESSMAQLPDYEFTQEKRPASETANGKNYMYQRYGIPSVTYEVGDETDRALINRAAAVFATEMMRLLTSTP